MVGERRGQHDHWAPHTTEVSLQGQQDSGDVAVTSCQVSAEKIGKGRGGRGRQGDGGGGGGDREEKSPVIPDEIFSVVSDVP